MEIYEGDISIDHGTDSPPRENRRGSSERHSKRVIRRQQPRRAGGLNETPKATLYITGFKRGTSARNLARVFEPFGNIAQVSVLPPRKSDGEQYGFVAFRRVNDMERVLEIYERGETLDNGLAIDSNRGIDVAKAKKLPVLRKAHQLTNKNRDRNRNRDRDRDRDGSRDKRNRDMSPLPPPLKSPPPPPPPPPPMEDDSSIELF